MLFGIAKEDTKNKAARELYERVKKLLKEEQCVADENFKNAFAKKL